MNSIISRNPATGETIQELAPTPASQLPVIFEQARAAQIKWSALSHKSRAKHLLHLREALLNHVDEIADLISRENGKPRFEAMANELIPSVDMLGLFAKRAPKVLRDQNIPMTLMKHR